MLRLFYCTLLFIFWLSQSTAQAPCALSLQGKVIDEHDQNTLEYAHVQLLEMHLTVVANQHGEYLFQGICPGLYTVIITHVGCEEKRDTVRVFENTRRDFYLEHHTELLKTIEINQEKDKNNSNTLLNMDAKQIQNKQGESLAKIAQNIPGINMVSSGGGIEKPMMHGLSGLRLNLILNGVRQEEQQWGSDHAPALDLLGADELHLSLGTDVKYGHDLLSGAIILQQKSLPENPFLNIFTGIGYQSNGRTGNLSCSVSQRPKSHQKLAWKLNLSTKYGGNTHTPNYFLGNTGQRAWNGSGQVYYDINSKIQVEFDYRQVNTNLGIFTGSHAGNLSDLNDIIAGKKVITDSAFSYALQRPYQHVEHETFRTKLNYKISGTRFFDVQYSRQYNLRNEFDKHRPRNDSLAGLNLPELHLALTTHQISTNYRHLFKTTTVEWGTFGEIQSNTYEGRFFIPNYSSRSAGTYLVGKYFMSNALLELGYRWDMKEQQAFMWRQDTIYAPKNTFWNDAAHVKLEYRASQHLMLTWRSGFGWRPPSVSELYSGGLHHSAASVEFGNVVLAPEKSINNHLLIGYRKSRITLDLTSYYNHYTDFIYLNPMPSPVVTIRGVFPAFQYQQTQAYITGVDYFIKYEAIPQRLNVSSNGSFIYARNITQQSHLPFIPANRYQVNAEFLFSKIRSIKPSLQVSFLQVNQQKNTSGVIELLLPPDSYQIWNINVSAETHAKGHRTVFSVGIENTLNTVYRDYLDRLRFYANAPGRNFILKVQFYY